MQLAECRTAVCAPAGSDQTICGSLRLLAFRQYEGAVVPAVVLSQPGH